jgi:FMN phosphatase YigB (HAD superfamily)
MPSTHTARAPDGPRAWLLDLDGTLYHARRLKLVMLWELRRASPAALATLRRFRQEHEWLRRHQTSPLTDPFQAQLERTAEARGTSVAEVAATVQHWMFACPGRWLRRFRRTSLLQAAYAFRAEGGRIAVVSDYPARAKLLALDCEDLAECVVACGEAKGPRWLKPHPDGYSLAAERLGVSAAECLVIGDRIDADGAAAERAGMAFQRV